MLIVNAPWLDRSNASNELVKVPVAVAASSRFCPDISDGVIYTSSVLTVGLSGSPLFSTPTPVTVYSHPVL